MRHDQLPTWLATVSDVVVAIGFTKEETAEDAATVIETSKVRKEHAAALKMLQVAELVALAALQKICPVVYHAPTKAKGKR